MENGSDSEAAKPKGIRFLSFIGSSLAGIDDCAKDGARIFLPRCIAFFNRIPIESLKIRNSNA